MNKSFTKNGMDSWIDSTFSTKAAALPRVSGALVKDQRGLCVLPGVAQLSRRWTGGRVELGDALGGGNSNIFVYAPQKLGKINPF